MPNYVESVNENNVDFKSCHTNNACCDQSTIKYLRQLQLVHIFRNTTSSMMHTSKVQIRTCWWWSSSSYALPYFFNSIRKLGENYQNVNNIFHKAKRSRLFKVCLGIPYHGSTLVFEGMGRTFSFNVLVYSMCMLLYLNSIL